MLREAAATPNTKRTQRLRRIILGKLLGTLRIWPEWFRPTYARLTLEDKQMTMVMNGLMEIHITYSPETFGAFATLHHNGSGGPGEEFPLIHDNSTPRLVLERVGRTNQVATALWLVLLTVFMQSHGCTVEQAIDAYGNWLNGRRSAYALRR